MARPIEPTPILEGEDAIRLLRDANSVNYDQSKEKFLRECAETFNKTKKQ